MPNKCEVVPLVYRRDSHGPAKLYGEPPKEVDRYEHLEISFGAKELDRKDVRSGYS